MTKQVTEGTIDGHQLTVTITGPEAQDLDGERVGSDVLMVRIERALAELKDDVENTDIESDEDFFRKLSKQSYSHTLDRLGYFCDTCDTETRNENGLVHFKSDRAFNSLNVCHDCLPEEFE